MSAEERDGQRREHVERYVEQMQDPDFVFAEDEAATLRPDEDPPVDGQHRLRAMLDERDA